MNSTTGDERVSRSSRAVRSPPPMSLAACAVNGDAAAAAAADFVGPPFAGRPLVGAPFSGVLLGGVAVSGWPSKSRTFSDSCAGSAPSTTSTLTPSCAKAGSRLDASCPVAGTVLQQWVN